LDSISDNARLRKDLISGVTIIALFFSFISCFDYLKANSFDKMLDCVQNIFLTALLYIVSVFIITTIFPKKKSNGGATMDNPTNAMEMYNLAYDYAKGRNGKSISYESAVRWLKKSADLGFPAAMLDLGVTYMGDSKGQRWWDVPIDYIRGNEWLRKAIGAGDREIKCEALKMLATSYVKGEGVPVNKQKARELFQEAVALGDREAVQMLLTI
jgi:hypothetical protein